MKYMYRKLAGGDVVQAANTPATSPGRVLTGFNKVSDVLTQISWLFLFRRVRLLLKDNRSTVAQTPGTD
jgi:hypothetical protein